MSEWLASVLNRLHAGQLLRAEYFSSLDCDAALDARDGDKDFATEWTQLFEQVNRAWTTARPGDDVRSLAEDIRRESFLAVSRATRQHEIASYVSDDFDLVVRCRLTGITSELLTQIWAAYESGKFPSPPL